MHSLSSAKMAAPLGQLVLATKVNQINEIPARVYNLEISSEEDVKNDILSLIGASNSPLASLTLSAGNVFNSLKLAVWLKSLGCTVIVGGPEVTELSASHYANLSAVDAAVVGNAESLICCLVNDGLQQELPNLFTKEIIPAIQHLLLDFQKISVNYFLLFELSKHAGVSILWGSDCHLANKRCFFCSRQKKGIGFRDENLVWQELEIPLQHGIHKFYNTADTIARKPKQFQRFVEARPDNFKNTIQKVFINATQVNDEITGYLHRLNAWTAIGIESLTRVESSGKGKTNTDDNYRAIDILAKNNVDMILTFILGLPNESTESMRRDGEKLLRIIEKYGNHIVTVTVSPLLITIGSKAFERFYDACNSSLPIRHQGEFYNPLSCSTLYFNKFCSVTEDDIIRQICYLQMEIANINPNIVFDSKGLDPEKYFNIKTSI